MARSTVPSRGKVFFESAPDIVIRNGLAHVTVESGDIDIVMVCTPHTLLVAIERAKRAYETWVASDYEAKPIRKRAAKG